jgi:ABC-type multidrug transport system fused ATPase/permease subunit
MLFWLGAAVLGLVVLRKGVKEGIPVLAWGCLPALVLWTVQGDATAFMVLIDTYLLAYVLREKVSWAWVMLLASILAVISSLVQPLLMANILNIVADLIQQILAREEVGDIPSKDVIIQQAVIAMSVMQAYISVAALFLARRWQALLFNPGGLKQEFHQLRLPLPIALILGAMVLVGESLGGGFEILSRAALPALVLPGLALVHGVLALKKIGMVGLVAFYLIGFFVLSLYFANILIMIAVIDSFVDIRGRIQSKPSNFN